MSTHAAVYVSGARNRRQRLHEVAQYLRGQSGSLRGRYEVRRYLATDWLEVICTADRFGGLSVDRLARDLRAEVIAVAIHASTNAFEYRHYCDTQLLRELVYGVERRQVWARCDGEVEPWEHDALFDPVTLQELLEDVVTPEEGPSVERAFARHEVRQGDTQPAIDASRALFALGEHLQLPGLCAALAFDDTTVEEIVLGHRDQPLNVASWVLIAAGALCLALNGAASAALGALGGAGAVLTWSGFALRLRSAPATVALGGGFVLAGLTLLAAFSIGALFR
jgi:hypothetical protein